MKRSGPLRRKTPLQRKTPLERGTTPLARSRSVRTKRRRAAMSPKLRALVQARAGDHCDRCGVWTGERFEAHHRKLRSRGGKDSPENLVALCRGCHHDEVHANPTEATAAGFMVPSGADPATVPVRRFDGISYLPVGDQWVMV